MQAHRRVVGEHDLSDFLRGLVAQVEPLAQRKGIELKLVIEPATCMAWCDLERVERVWRTIRRSMTQAEQEQLTFFFALNPIEQKVRLRELELDKILGYVKLGEKHAVYTRNMSPHLERTAPLGTEEERQQLLKQLKS